MWNEKKLKEIEEMWKDWEESCLKTAFDAQSERREKFLTDIGLNIGRVYTPLDLHQIDFDYKENLGFPGQYTFTRGITPLMYRSEPWVIRAYSGFGDTQSCHERYKKLVGW